MKGFIRQSLEEDGFMRNSTYLLSLPEDPVECVLKIKSDAVISGLPFFCSVFSYFNQNLDLEILNWEGQFIEAGREYRFKLPFSVALTGERLALNLLQRSSAISTLTSQMVKLCDPIKILDTRKTTPGMRFLEKYAVLKGGGFNHRFDQSDVWMICW